MISALAAALAFCLSVYNALTYRGRREFEDMLKETKLHDERLMSLENSVKHLPDHGQITEMRLAIEMLKGQLSVIAERVEPIKAIAERLQLAMLEHK